MIDDVYQLALSAVRRHLEKAAVAYREDDGDLVIGDHRLGLSIHFEGFTRQGDQAIAPLDIQIHLDGDEGDRFRIGTLGVGATQQAALKSAVDEWHLLAVSPLLAALGAEVGARRRSSTPVILAGWRLFAGRAGLRGAIPADLQSGGAFFAQLLAALRAEVAAWEEPRGFQLRSILVLASAEPPNECATGSASAEPVPVSENDSEGATAGLPSSADPANEGATGCSPRRTSGSSASVVSSSHQVQAAVDGFLSQSLTDRLSILPWPTAAGAYFYKQMFVLRRECPA